MMPALRQSAPVEEVRVGRSTVRFYLGDCLEVLPKLEPRSVGVVVTSPPYNIGVKYRTYGDDLPRAEYLHWTDRWLRAVATTLMLDGSLFLNVGAKPTDPWLPFDVAQAARKHFALQNSIHWVKSIAIDRESAGQNAALDRDLALGHYKPVNSDRFVNDCHEFVFQFTGDGRIQLDRLAIGVPYQDKTNVTRWGEARPDADRRCRGNTWFIPYETIQRRDRDRPHPATFPPKLPEHCIRLHGVGRAGTVLDPFLGLGNSAIAAMRLGLDFIGIELDEAYLREAVQRVKAAVSPKMSTASQVSQVNELRPCNKDVRPCNRHLL